MVNWEATNLQRLLLDDGSAELCLAACRILAPRKTRATTKAMLVIPNLIENSVQKMPTKFSSRIHNHSWRKFGSHTKAAISRNATGMIHFSTVPNHAGGCPPSKSRAPLAKLLVSMETVDLCTGSSRGVSATFALLFSLTVRALTQLV